MKNSNIINMKYSPSKYTNCITPIPIPMDHPWRKVIHKETKDFGDWTYFLECGHITKEFPGCGHYRCKICPQEPIISEEKLDELVKNVLTGLAR